MMYTTAAVSVLLWLLGLACGYTMGGAIHVLLIVAIILFVVKRMGDRKQRHLFEHQTRNKQLRSDLGANKTWHLK
ncbi:MAG TPA: lmo0937 family membrane protein [Verrucomicrobiae bacterium]|jgi:hypothetical protein|nr:lmo0937 family membrane protein [Verrucomicrobiae bacterium]